MSFFEPPPPQDQREPPFEIPEPKPWWHAPSNELGAPVPLRLVLARTDQIGVAVIGVTAYTTGFALTLAVRGRSTVGEDALYPEMEMLGGRVMRRWADGEIPPDLLRFGVQFADGRRATTLGTGAAWRLGSAADEEEPSGPILSPLGGGGGDREWNQEYWLWPLPPPGTLTFAVEWPSKGIELSMREVDAGLIIDASKSSEVLWPDAGESARVSLSRDPVFLRAASDEEPPEDEEHA